MAAAIHIPNVRVRKGVPLPDKLSSDSRKASDVIAGLKKGESFIIASEYRNKVLVAANYLRRTGAISFGITSKHVIEGGVPAVCIWRVEE